MAWSIEEKGRRNLENFIEFLDEEKLGEEFTRLLRDKIRKDVRMISSTRPEMTLLRATSTQLPEDWFGTLIAAIIDSSRTFSPGNIGTNVDLFSRHDTTKDLISRIKIKTRFVENVTIAGAEFASEIIFRSEDKDIMNLLRIRQLGGEFVTEGEDGEKKTYTLNAVRGTEMTTRLESQISESLKGYFAANTDTISEEIHEKFIEWAKKKKVKVEKG